MKTDLSWDDLRFFAEVARAGSLSAAAAAHRTSIPTLSRRMRALEAQLGRALFQHGRAGYQLTPDGRALLEQTAPMQAASQSILAWHTAGTGAARVRISAGHWTARRLARDISNYWSPSAPWVPEFVASDATLDLARREIDIGIRNRRPDHPWLAARRTAKIDYACYGTKDAPEGFIGVAGSSTPTAKWLEGQTQVQIVTKVSDPMIAAELARAGVGRVVLPCFAGDAEDGLTRLSPPIAELRSEEWLVSHQDARHEPPIRHALDALAQYLAAAPEP